MDYNDETKGVKSGLESYGEVCIQLMVKALHTSSIYYHGDPFNGGKLSFQFEENSDSLSEYMSVEEYNSIHKDELKGQKAVFARKIYPTDQRIRRGQLAYSEALDSLSLIETLKYFARSQQGERCIDCSYQNTEAQMLGRVRIPEDVEKIYIYLNPKYKGRDEDIWRRCLYVFRNSGTMMYSKAKLSEKKYNMLMGKLIFSY